MSSTAPTPGSRNRGRVAIINARVFDGTTLLDPATVVIDGTVIGEDAAGAEMIDAAGAVLLPGFIDAHVHIDAPEQLHTLAAWGVTTGLDMACWPADRVAALRRVRGGADFRSAGLPAIGDGGPHSCMPGMDADAIVRTPEDARRHVAQRVSEGVDYIKGVAEAPGDGGPSSEVLHALVAAAREHGRKTVIHAGSRGAYTMAVESGAEFITHVPLDGVIDPRDIAAMKANRQSVIPTMTMMEGILAKVAPHAPIDHLIASVGALHGGGVEIIAGTDANTAPGPPARVEHGESLHHEFELMAAAGLTPAEILRCATVRPAAAFGLSDRGVIAPGKRADLLLVEGDPTADITATRNVRAVWCAGVEHAPAGR
ncbi:amidohydrolase family protein [Gordonia sp. TBRC 11910]|uniref:Amidohydrolase family protein n=1 Tax=Gordonia asplenii TaxID=2725283 RepID=A0A848KY43_9ACTN|nr:amidohydrolase family protein [Gordonia asplenii]NMO03664.1 amidohydrolase family protein [Gordonia asplenii]